MTNLIYITHPAVEIKPAIPVEQWPISDVGRKQVSHLVKLLRWDQVDAIYSSQENKALVTAEAIFSKWHHLIHLPAKSGFPELGEINRTSTGFLAKDDYLEAMKFFYEKPNQSYKGWETADHVRRSSGNGLHNWN